MQEGSGERPRPIVPRGIGWRKNPCRGSCRFAMRQSGWLACHAEAAVLPLKKRLKHAAVLAHEIHVAQSKLQHVQGRLACE